MLILNRIKTCLYQRQCCHFYSVHAELSHPLSLSGCIKWGLHGECLFHEDFQHLWYYINSRVGTTCHANISQYIRLLNQHYLQYGKSGHGPVQYLRAYMPFGFKIFVTVCYITVANFSVSLRYPFLTVGCDCVFNCIFLKHLTNFHSNSELTPAQDASSATDLTDSSWCLIHLELNNIVSEQSFDNLWPFWCQKWTISWIKTTISVVSLAGWIGSSSYVTDSALTIVKVLLVGSQLFCNPSVVFCWPAFVYTCWFAWLMSWASNITDFWQHWTKLELCTCLQL